MKNTLKKVLAFMLVFCFVFAFAACKDNNEKETTTAAATTADDTTTATVATTTAAGETTTITGETTTAAPTTPGETTTAVAAIIAPIGGTPAQILAFYNQYANSTKAFKGRVTVSKSEGTTSLVTKMAMFKDKAQEMLPNDYPKNDTKTFTNGKSGDKTLAGFLLRGEGKTMSDLVVAGVNSATCTADGTGWKVVIVVISETVEELNGIPKYHSQCMDTLDISAEDLGDFTLGSATVTYKEATITTKINAQGYLDSLSVSEPNFIKGTLGYKGFNVIPVEVEGDWKGDYTFKY